MVAGVVWPSSNRTETVPPLAAMEMTWLFVRTYPSDRITSPEPVPAPPAPWALIVTIDGSVRDATVAAAHTDLFDESDPAAGHTIRPPINPPTTAIPAAATHNPHDGLTRYRSYRRHA